MMYPALLDVAVAPMLIYPIVAILLILGVCTGVVVGAVFLIRLILRRKKEREEKEE